MSIQETNTIMLIKYCKLDSYLRYIASRSLVSAANLLHSHRVLYGSCTPSGVLFCCNHALNFKFLHTMRWKICQVVCHTKSGPPRPL